MAVLVLLPYRRARLLRGAAAAVEVGSSPSSRRRQAEPELFKHLVGLGEQVLELLVLQAQLGSRALLLCWF
jgi:hypothetical protein